jgi:class 3 adenylate cyclase/CheY-like chemotaxis protein
MQQKTGILIAEDENIIAKDIARSVKKLGYHVLDFARTGDDAVKKAMELKPDLILMDIMLDGKTNGIEAAQKLKSSLDIPVIYLTALADEETLNRAKITEPFGYILKPFDEKTLHSSIEMALYKHQINFKLKEKTFELEEEKKRSDKLLNNILPGEIIQELKEKGIITPREYKLVTLLFTDFQGFTSLSAKMSPNKLVDELNDIFKSFDAIVSKHGLEKLKTIGDSYMAACGLPKENSDHALKVILAAIEMRDYLCERNKTTDHQWKMRIGIHSGSVIAGVIGKNKFAYDVWGDTVNIASKMEKHSKPGEINITGNTLNLIKDYFEYEYHDNLELSDDNFIDMYFIKKYKKTESASDTKSIHYT